MKFNLLGAQSSLNELHALCSVITAALRLHQTHSGSQLAFHKNKMFQCCFTAIELQAQPCLISTCVCVAVGNSTKPTGTEKSASNADSLAVTHSDFNFLIQNIRMSS